MKLFLKSADQKLFSNYLQHAKDGNIKNQNAIVKIFNPYGAGTWYIINSDPNDPDYLWGIAVLDEVEMGSISRSDLENIRFGKFQLPLERELYFEPINAEELYKKLLKDRHDDFISSTKKSRPTSAIKKEEHPSKKPIKDKTTIVSENQLEYNLEDKTNEVYDLVIKEIKAKQKQAKKEDIYYPQEMYPDTLAEIKKGIGRALFYAIPEDWIIKFVTGTFVKIAHPTNSEAGFGNPLLSFGSEYIEKYFTYFIDQYLGNFYEGGFKYLTFPISDLKKIGFNTMITKTYSGKFPDGSEHTSKYDIWINDDGKSVISFEKGRSGEGGYSSFYSKNFRKGYELQKKILSISTYVKEVDWFANSYGSLDAIDANIILADKSKTTKMTVIKEDSEHYTGKVYDDTTEQLMKLLMERISKRKYEYTPKPEALNEIRKGIEKCQKHSIPIDYVHAFVLGTLITTEGEKEGMYSPQLYTFIPSYISGEFLTFIENTKANMYQAGWKYLDFDVQKLQDIGFKIHHSNKEIKSYNSILKRETTTKFDVWISEDFRHIFTVGGSYMGLVSTDTERGFSISQAITNSASYVKDVDYWINGLGGMSLKESMKELSLAMEKRLDNLKAQIKSTNEKLEHGGKLIKKPIYSNSEAQAYIRYMRKLSNEAKVSKKPKTLLEDVTIIERPEKIYEPSSFIKKSTYKREKGGIIEFSDGFKFEEVTKDYAIKNWKEKHIYALNISEETESLIQSKEDLDKNTVFGIELGFRQGGDLQDLAGAGLNLYEKGGEVIYNDDESIDDIVKHFIDAALWASSDDEDNPLDDIYEYEDVNSESLSEIREKVKAFLKKNSEIIKKHQISKFDLGHDLFLTSRGHGAGFWDRGYGDDGDVLSKSSEEIFKSDSPYAGDDGKIYFNKGGEMQNLEGGAGLNLFEKGGTTSIEVVDSLEPFIEIAKNSRNGEDFYKRAKDIKVTPEVSAKWRNKYDPENKLSIITTADIFVKEINKKNNQKRIDLMNLSKADMDKFKTTKTGRYNYLEFRMEYRNRAAETVAEFNKRVKPIWNKLVKRYS